MDECLKAEQVWRVFKTATKPALDQKPVATFRARPYSRAGFDYAVWKGKMYDGYVDGSGVACIFLDRETFKPDGRTK